MANLSICIPTYNRSTHLSRTLDLLTRSIQQAKSDGLDIQDIEILIGDNASSDDTQLVIEKSDLNSLPECNVFNVKRDRNIGAEENWFDLAVSSTGDYFWLLSDDDTFLPCIISFILVAIKSRPDVIFLNYADSLHSSPDTLTEDINYSCKNSEELKMQSTSGCGDATYFEYTKFKSSFISSNLFKKSSFKLHASKIRDNLRFPYIQLSVSNFLLINHGKWLAINNQLIEMKSPTVLESRRRASLQGHKSFYLTSWVDAAIFINNTSASEKLKAKTLKAAVSTVLREKHCINLLRFNQFEPRFWLHQFRRLSTVKYFSSRISTYIVLLPIMLLPAFCCEPFYWTFRLKVFFVRFCRKLRLWFSG